MRLPVVLAVVFGTLLPFSSAAFGQPKKKDIEDGRPKKNNMEDVDLFGLLLIASDVENASSMMTRYDRNKDHRLKGGEMSELPASAKRKLFDVDKDGALTQVELAIYFSYRRREYWVWPLDERVAAKQMSRFDRNKDKRLNENEIREADWPEGTENFDLDKDGYLTLFELTVSRASERRALTESGITGWDRIQARKFVTQNDSNGDRQIDAEEFRAATSEAIPRSFDADNNGLLTVTEITAGFAALRRKEGATVIDQRLANQRLKRYDRNRNGVLDEHEVEGSGWPPDPERFDLNKDGRIDHSELTIVFARDRIKGNVKEQDQVLARDLLARYDTNRNRVIEITETDLDKSKQVPKGSIEITIDAFVDADLDSDQKLTMRELELFVVHLRKKEAAAKDKKRETPNRSDPAPR